MKFGFIAHPTSLALKRQVKLCDLLGRAVQDAEQGFDPALWQAQSLVPFARFGQIHSGAGARCEGLLQYLPLTAEEMLRQPRQIAERVLRAVDALAGQGAELVGLGGFTGIVGNRGLQTLERARVPVTTGNSLTAYASWRNLLDVMALLELEPQQQEVAIVGYPGSIALVVAKLLEDSVGRLLLVHRGGGDRLAEQLQYLGPGLRERVRLTDRIEDCYDKPRLFLAATSSGDVIEEARLAPGSVVVDAALPRDVRPAPRRREDVLIIDGGLVSADRAFSLGTDTLGLSPTRMMNGCLAETMVLALEGRREAFSIGRELDVDKVREIGRLAQRHGITPERMSAYGEPLKPADVRALARFHAAGAPRAVQRPGRLHEEVLQDFGAHINPVMREFFELNHIDRVFVKAEGCTLQDAEGREFLDFVAGYGCLNMGHNHPRCVGALRHFLDSGAPSFVQYVSAPELSSRLAARLAALVPGGLSRVFFCNSGTEAVEAALKLAMAAAAPGQRRVLYCDNGYHGKTLGALSVTGRDKHRQPFMPLIERCSALPFGDLAALEAALQSGDVAAFILEPIQGEGGVILPPPGYLRGVRELCDRHGCLMILDEIQTGLGRTGRMFACEWEGVAPDLMVLAKSLSGGLVPIGAMLARPDLWDRAYGSRDRFSLHSSTFGGGNLAAAVALEALAVLEEEDLAGRALRTGEALLAALQEVAAGQGLIREVRGRGLMIAIEFAPSFEGAVQAFVQEFSARLPGQPRAMYRFLSDRARAHLEAAVPELERSLEEMLVLRIVSKLSQEHGILSFVTANNSKVLRIQPPLTLSDAQAQHFVRAIAQVCSDLSTVPE